MMPMRIDSRTSAWCCLRRRSRSPSTSRPRRLAWSTSTDPMQSGGRRIRNTRKMREAPTGHLHQRWSLFCDRLLVGGGFKQANSIKPGHITCDRRE